MKPFWFRSRFQLSWAKGFCEPFRIIKYFNEKHFFATSENFFFFFSIPVQRQERDCNSGNNLLNALIRSNPEIYCRRKVIWITNWTRFNRIAYLTNRFSLSLTFIICNYWHFITIFKPFQCVFISVLAQWFAEIFLNLKFY